MRLSREQARALGIIGPEKDRTAGMKRAASDKEQGRDRVFDALCKKHGLPVPVHEYRFHPTRMWRFDYVFQGWLVLEVQGGLFVQGRHSQGAALLKEHEKLNEAVCRGYCVLFCTPQDIKTGAIFPVIKRALECREEGA